MAASCYQGDLYRSLLCTEHVWLSRNVSHIRAALELVPNLLNTVVVVIFETCPMIEVTMPGRSSGIGYHHHHHTLLAFRVNESQGDSGIHR